MNRKGSILKHISTKVDLSHGLSGVKCLIDQNLVTIHDYRHIPGNWIFLRKDANFYTGSFNSAGWSENTQSPVSSFVKKPKHYIRPYPDQWLNHIDIWQEGIIHAFN